MIIEKVLNNIIAKYSNFTDISLLKFATKFSKYTKIKNYFIKLIINQQSSYRPIYSLEPVELKILKTYIKTNLANSFIYSFKFLARTFILFIPKLDNSFLLCINYQSLNNFTIKNWYLFLLIGKLLDQLG